MNPIYYLIQSLYNYNFSVNEVKEFLTVIYNCKYVYSKDLESQFACNGNSKYLDAYILFIDEIEGLTIQELVEYSVNLDSNNKFPYTLPFNLA